MENSIGGEIVESRMFLLFRGRIGHVVPRTNSSQRLQRFLTFSAPVALTKYPLPGFSTDASQASGLRRGSYGINWEYVRCFFGKGRGWKSSVSHICKVIPVGSSYRFE